MDSGPVGDPEKVHKRGDQGDLTKPGQEAEKEIPESGAHPDVPPIRGHHWRTETWILKVDRVVCSPDASPTLPHGAEIKLVVLANNDHVKGVAVLMGRATWWSSWKATESLLSPAVQARLLGACPECGCYPRLYTRAGRKVKECACGFLEFRNQCL